MCSFVNTLYLKILKRLYGNLGERRLKASFEPPLLYLIPYMMSLLKRGGWG